MKLSIIIPYYNEKEYTDELMKVLAPQIRDDIEVILIDDGSRAPYESEYEWLTIIRQENKGAAGARNTGMNIAKGDYIAFIDNDDMIADYYVEKLLQKINESGADIINLSWRGIEEDTCRLHKLEDDNDVNVNVAPWARALKRTYIGETRMNENKDAGEDEDFSRRLGFLDPESGCTHASITEYMYFFRTQKEDSLSHRFQQGLTKTKRIAYYYPHVTEDMTWLLEEIKREDEHNEVLLMTRKNDIPELKRYCRIRKPIHTWAHVLRGEPYKDCEVIKI